MTLEDLLSRLIPGLERAQVPYIGGTAVSIASPEDVLLAKLQWAKLGESNRQLEDAGGILRTQADKLDLTYIERCVRDLNVEEQWQWVREKFS